jgi:hypothetical protein
MLLRPIRDKLLERHMHRSGWPYVMASLEPLFDDSAPVVFDDFVDKTFSNKREQYQNSVQSVPWVGVCHHPPDVPSWYDTERLQSLEDAPGWAESMKSLRLCVVLAENLASWIRLHWGVPCISIKHPSEIPDLRWSPGRFLGNRSKMLLQVGWYLRNTHAIYQAHIQSLFTKARLHQTSAEIVENHWRCAEHAPPGRRWIGEVREIPAVTNCEYDRLLSENVVFVELLSAAANNTVVECIARNTPIVINRHAGPEYYLGPHYPLFYDDFDTLHDFVTTERVIAAHEYLCAMDKGWLDGCRFREQFREACISHVAELKQV